MALNKTIVGRLQLLSVGLALFVSSWATAAWSDDDDVEDATAAAADASVDAEYGQAYNEFIDNVRRLPAMLGPQFKDKYEITDAQTEELTRLLGEQVEKLLNTHGHAIFDLKEKAETVQKYASQSGIRFEDIDGGIRRELADDALALAEVLSVHYGSFADKAEAALEGRSRALLRKDRMQAEVGMKAGIKQLRVMAGREAPDGTPLVQPKPQQPTVRLSAQDTRNAWQKYVDEFALRHALDEVQKLRAQKLLDTYSARLSETVRARESQAASQPAVRAGSRAAFAQRLRQGDPRDNASGQLFEQMVTELKQIPTPVQNRLAEVTQASEPATKPGGR